MINVMKGDYNKLQFEKEMLLELYTSTMKNVDHLIDSKDTYQRIVYEIIKNLKLCGDNIDFYDKLHSILDEMKTI